MRDRPGSFKEWRPIAALGLMTCTCYGSWFYAFGILVAPIAHDTGWSLTFLGGIFATAQVINGLGAPLGGRILDKWGGSAVFTIQAVAALTMLLGTWATQPLIFAIICSLGAGTLMATGFYHVSTTAAARLRPSDPSKSIAVLTAIGAFCSPIYLPLGAYLVTTTEWRSTFRIFCLLAIFGAIGAAIFAPKGRSPSGSLPSPRPLRALRTAVQMPLVRRMLIAYGFGGFAYSTLLVYQIPIMVDAGVTLQTAASAAAFRGFMQIFGRVGIIGSFAIRKPAFAMQFAFLTAGIGSIFLLSQNVISCFLYGAAVGIGLGAMTPLQAIYGQLVFKNEDLGLLMGMQHTVTSLSGAFGPLLAGATSDLFNTQKPTVVIASSTLFIAAALLRSIKA
ncbi:MAG: MFS transporter [Actinomycetota bacterium]|nr:MFS transporter [Actinomycetota bacterium]